MKPTFLKDNLNAAMIAAQSALSPKKAPKKVVVYVESDDDIAFWRNVLEPFGNEYHITLFWFHF